MKPQIKMIWSIKNSGEMLSELKKKKKFNGQSSPAGLSKAENHVGRNVYKPIK